MLGAFLFALGWLATHAVAFLVGMWVGANYYGRGGNGGGEGGGEEQQQRGRMAAL